MKQKSLCGGTPRILLEGARPGVSSAFTDSPKSGAFDASAVALRARPEQCDFAGQAISENVPLYRGEGRRSCRSKRARWDCADLPALCWHFFRHGFHGRAEGSLEGTSDRKLAVSYVKEAVDLSRAEHLETQRIVEVLAEYALAMWNVGEHEAAFLVCEDAVGLLFDRDESHPYWKKLFLAAFKTVHYLSAMVFFGRAPNIPHYQPPSQGLFLGLDNVDTKKFVPVRKAYLKIRMAMFAEGVGKTSNAGKWTVEALAVARDVAGAKTIYDFTWLDIVPEILQNNYAEAVRMALLMADSRSASLPVLEEGFTEPSEKQRIQKFLDDPQKGTLGMMFVATALAFRLATLLISGKSAEKISIAIQDVIEARPGDSRVENISNALHAGLLEDHSWSDLRTRGESLINTDTAVGLVHYVGSALKRPLAQALTMQVWLAQTAEFTFKGFKSLQRLIIWPFFFAFWSDVVTREPEQFRTSQSYARRQVEMSAEGASSDSVKQLLASMWFCLGVDLSESAKAWLRAR